MARALSTKWMCSCSGLAALRAHAAEAVRAQLLSRAAEDKEIETCQGRPSSDFLILFFQTAPFIAGIAAKEAVFYLRRPLPNSQSAALAAGIHLSI